MAIMKNKPISFNLDNPKEQMLYDHVKNIENFSGYAKALIMDDLNKKSATDHTPGIKIHID